MGNSYNAMDALHEHKKRLKQKHEQISELLVTIDKTIRKEKGEIVMKNVEKFQGLKEKLISDNEEKFGDEIRDLYGSNSIEESYQKIRKISKWELNEATKVEKEIIKKLGKALSTADIQSKLSMEVCSLHEKWIKMYWSTYSKKAHLQLVEMYTQDDRFKLYYEKAGEGATTFLYQAMKLYIKKDH